MGISVHTAETEMATTPYYYIRHYITYRTHDSSALWLYTIGAYTECME